MLGNRFLSVQPSSKHEQTASLSSPARGCPVANKTFTRCAMCRSDGGSRRTGQLGAPLGLELAYYDRMQNSPKTQSQQQHPRMCRECAANVSLESILKLNSRIQEFKNS